MAPRLKVFVTSNGLTDFVVATSSRRKALAAWGVRQDLFKEGAAQETDDPDLVAAALAKPGEVIERAGRSRGAIKAQAARTPARRGPSKAQLAKQKRLEDKLSELEERHAQALADLAAERRALDDRERKLSEDFDSARTKLRRDLDSLTAKRA